MSRVEEFDPEPGRDLAPLVRALQSHGTDLTLASWASVPGAPVTVYLHLLEDEYREHKCRQLIKQWRAGTLS